MAEWCHDRVEYLAVKIVFALEYVETGGAIVLAEQVLTVDLAVVAAEEAVDELTVFGGYAGEAVVLDGTELVYQLAVYLELGGSVLALVAEGLTPGSAEGEQACHVEGWVDENAWYAAQLLGVHGSHAGGDNEVGGVVCDVLVQEGHGLKG